MNHLGRAALDQVYAAPNRQSPAAQLARAAVLRTRAAKLLGGSAAAFALAIGVMVITSSAVPGVLFFTGAAVLAAVGVGVAFAALGKGMGALAGAGAAASAIALLSVNLGMTMAGALAAFLSTIGEMQTENVKTIVPVEREKRANTMPSRAPSG